MSLLFSKPAQHTHNHKKLELLSSQVERCDEILKRLTLNPVEEDDFIDNDLSMKEYLNEIISSFREISQKKFIFNYDQYSNVKKITKSIEIVYGLRNFIGNANKFSKEAIHINLKSDSEITEITIEDDGNGYPKDVLSKMARPYLDEVGLTDIDPATRRSEERCVGKECRSRWSPYH